MISGRFFICRNSDSIGSKMGAGAGVHEPAGSRIRTGLRANATGLETLPLPNFGY
jgi:hypothetical protein